VSVIGSVIVFFAVFVINKVTIIIGLIIIIIIIIINGFCLEIDN